VVDLINLCCCVSVAESRAVRFGDMTDVDKSDIEGNTKGLGEPAVPS
jgi:hypothetical protein